jgi:hypothetical protein
MAMELSCGSVRLIGRDEDGEEQRSSPLTPDPRFAVEATAERVAVVGRQGS